MDIQRSILLVGLAVVSYLLVLQWNQDYGQAPLPAASSATQSTTSPLPELTASNNDDVPTASQDEAQAPAADAPAASQSLIRVQTDVLDLAIDPRGGDIVQLTLPQYPRRQDRPDVPFQLFDNGNERVYLAQSGLTGSNGPDARSSGRPLYHSATQHYQLSDDQQQLVVDLQFSEAGVDYTKRFTLQRGQYDLKVSYLINNQSEQPWVGNMFAQLKRDGSGDPSSTTATGTATYLGAALWTADEPYKKVSMGDMDEKQLRQTVAGGWVAWLQHYFVTAWIPAADSNNVVQTR